MAFTIQPYTLGDPITPNTTYSLPSLTHSAAALTSTYPKVVLEVVTKAPADDAWSNILPIDYLVNGEVCGTMLDLTAGTSQILYFRVPVTDPAVKYATLKLDTLGFNYPNVGEIKTYEDASGATSGYWEITSLVEKGSVHTLSVVQANLGVSDPNITQPVINILGVGGDSNVRSVMREGQQGPAQFPFLPDSLRTVVHLSAPEGFTYKFTVQKVNFGGASGGFDPTQDADITGTWSFSKVSGLTMNNEAPIILGQGVNAVKIHGSGTGPAVIEGSNTSTLSIAIPLSLQESTTVHDGLIFDSSTITIPKDVLTFVGPSATIRFAQSADGNLHMGPAKAAGMTIGTTGAVAFSGFVYLKGASFEQGVTFASTINTAGAATFSSGIQTPATAVSYFGPLTQLQGTDTGGLLITGGLNQSLKTNLTLSLEKGIEYGIVAGSDTPQVLETLFHPTISTYGFSWAFTANNGYYALRDRTGTGQLVFDPANYIIIHRNIDVKKGATFGMGVTLSSTLTVAGEATFTGNATRTTKASPSNIDILNKEMADTLYLPKATGMERAYFSARYFSNMNNETSYTITGIPGPALYKVCIDCSGTGFTGTSQISFPQANTSRSFVYSSDVSGLLNFHQPTLEGANLTTQATGGKVIELDMICSASNPTPVFTLTDCPAGSIKANCTFLNLLS